MGNEISELRYYSIPCMYLWAGTLLLRKTIRTSGISNLKFGDSGVPESEDKDNKAYC